MSYVRRFRQHIPFYKSKFPDTDVREFWHNHRDLCDPDCRWGIPLVHDQWIMWVIEDDDPTGTIINFNNGENSKLTLCCLNEGDDDACQTLDVEVFPSKTLMMQKSCVVNGEVYQFNYARFKLEGHANCGLHYFKLIAYIGTPKERIFYSEPVHIYNETRRLYKLNINDSCGIGGVQWAKIWPEWPTIDGYEVYLPPLTEAAFVEEITNEEVEQDGKGNEIPLFESRDWRYQFDTAFVPEHYSEIIAELTQTDNNAITFPDRKHDYYEKIKRCESSITSDNDGCYTNTNISFLINRYTKDACCDNDPCECPEDFAIQAKSYSIDQAAAEALAVVGDIYIVPDSAAGPAWATAQNNIATWDGVDWVYTPNDKGLLAFVDDVSSYWISEGTIGAWRNFWMFVESATDEVSPDCTWLVVSVIPQGMFAKLQYRVSPGGPWIDSEQSLGGLVGEYLSADDWLSGVTHYTGSANTYDLRMVALNIGCAQSTSDELTYLQTENCI